MTVMKLPPEGLSQHLRINVEALRRVNEEELESVIALGEDLASLVDEFDKLLSERQKSGHFTEAGLREYRVTLAAPVIERVRHLEQEAAKAENSASEDLVGYWTRLRAEPVDILEYFRLKDMREAFRSLDPLDRETSLLQAARSGDDRFLRAILSTPRLTMQDEATAIGVSPEVLTEAQTIIRARIGEMASDTFRAKELRQLVSLALSAVHGDDRLANDRLAEMAALASAR
jgi:hypothetical protein